MLATLTETPGSARPSKVHLLRELLREELVHADPGARLAAEGELCTRYGESRNVVRDALELLRQEGLIARRRGMGTFAMTARAEHRATTMYFIGEDAGSSVARFETIAVEQIPAPPRAAERLRVDEGAALVSLHRRTWLDDRPFSLQTSLLPASIAGWLLDRPPDVEWYESLEAGGLALADAAQVVEATVADTHVAALLHVPAGSPVMLIERLLWLEDGRPAELGMVRCRGDRVGLRVTAARPHDPTEAGR